MNTLKLIMILIELLSIAVIDLMALFCLKYGNLDIFSQKFIKKVAIYISIAYLVAVTLSYIFI